MKNVTDHVNKVLGRGFFMFYVITDLFSHLLLRVVSAPLGGKMISGRKQPWKNLKQFCVTKSA
jgi:hypothetical protein